MTTSSGGRVTTSNGGAAKTPSAGRVTSDVEEQLADLSDLLQDVMENSTENESPNHQDFEYNIDLKNPGKLDRSLIDNLQNKSERSRKVHTFCTCKRERYIQKIINTRLLDYPIVDEKIFV